MACSHLTDSGLPTIRTHQDVRRCTSGRFPTRESVFPISREGGGAPRWRGDGKQLFFLSLDGTMMAADVDSTKGFTAAVPRRLFSTHLQPPANARPYAVTRDGTRFLIPRIGQGAPITVVLNWRARLSK